MNGFVYKNSLFVNKRFTLVCLFAVLKSLFYVLFCRCLLYGVWQDISTNYVVRYPNELRTNCNMGSSAVQVYAF